MSEDRDPPQFDGLGGLLDVWSAAPGDVPPLSFEFRPEPDAMPGPDFVPPPPESADWSEEEWRRFAGINLVRGYEQSMVAALFGADMPAVSWEYAADLYDRVQAEVRREAEERWAQETRLYWSGRPDAVTRQILYAYGLTAQQIGLVRKSAFSPEYRRRQRARVKRGRR